MPARRNQQRAGGTAPAHGSVDSGVRRPGSVSGFSDSRARIIQAARTLACQEGYSAVTVTSLIPEARVSSKTFYENFSGAEDCFIAAYDEAMAEIEAVMRPAYMRPGTWTERVRAALQALLVLLDEDHQLATLVFLEAPKARQLLEGRRTRILEILQLVLDSGRSGAHTTVMPTLIDEMLVEGAISVIRNRVASSQSGDLSRLLGELMEVITYAYIGRPSGVAARAALTPSRVVAPTLDQASVKRHAPVRMTYRSLRVITAILDNPGATNRQVADAAGINDPGQMSKLLRRLSDQEVIRNEGVPRNGAPKHWHLTDYGRALQQRGQRDLDRRGSLPER